MVDRAQLREHMDVVGSDGERIGKIDSIDGDRIKLTKDASPDGEHHFVNVNDVARVDDRVHLSKTRAAVLAGVAATASATAGAATAGVRNAIPEVKNPAVADASPRKNYMLPWIIGGLLLLGLILLLTQCGDKDRDDAARQTTTTEATTTTQRYAGAPLEEGSLAYQLDQFLASTDGLPRTFTFDKINFDTGASTIRGVEQSDLNDIARVFAAYPNARAAIIGYTDAQGSSAANQKLGGERARSVIAALQQRGVDAGRFEARTGGQNDPVATNATGGGRLENRRTELVLLKR